MRKDSSPQQKNIQFSFMCKNEVKILQKKKLGHIHIKLNRKETVSVQTATTHGFILGKWMKKQNWTHATTFYFIGNFIFSFRFILQTNILEEITTSPTSSQASLVVADIVMTGNELMEMRESTTAGIQTTGMLIVFFHAQLIGAVFDFDFDFMTAHLVSETLMNIWNVISLLHCCCFF